MPDVDVPRNKRGQPLIIPAPGDGHLAIKSGPNKGYIAYDRASGFGSNLDDKTSLVDWQKRQVARGMALLAQNSRLVVEHDPSEEPDIGWLKNYWNELAEEAMTAIGSGLKAELGTGIHYATEVFDLGGDVNELHPYYRERGEAYWRFCRERGLEPLSVERFIVNDDLRVAGTYDRVYRYQGGVFIGDVKTSSTLKYAGLSFGVQLAAYRNGALYDHRGGSRVSMSDAFPGIDRDTGWIVHVDRNAGGHVSLHRVDIGKGLHYAGLVSQIKAARSAGRKMIGDEE